MKPKILVTHQPFPETVALLATAGEVAAPETGGFSPEELRRHAADAVAMMGFMPDRVDAAFLKDAPHLRIVAAALKGYDNFDAAACALRGVRLTIVPDLLTVPTAELTIGLTLALARLIRTGDAHVRSGDFHGWEPRFYGRGIAGATIGLVGTGAIGRAIAQRFGGFEATLLYTDRNPLGLAEEARLGIAFRPLPNLLAVSDYVICCLPLTPETRHVIDGEALSRMRKGAFLVNPARGSLVDEAAVLAALERGRLAGYAADTFEMEDWALADRPRQIDPRLLAHPNTLFTPHLGSAVRDVRRAIEQSAAESILDFLSGREPRNAVC